ncbi:uridine kinase family protein [Dictyobacter vulcani]|nr:AAA family ATPase [Dictyobacter vulcani]
MPALISRIDDLPPAQVYLVAGPAASGKTTFSSQLASHLHAAVLSMDHYFVDEEHITVEHDEKYGAAPQWESPDAYDIQALGQNIRELLQDGETLIPQYSFVLNRRVGYQPMHLRPEQPLVIEGLYTIRCEQFFRDYVHSLVKVFVVADLDIRRARARVRDVEERGKALEVFELRRYFVELGEQRWGMMQERDADCVLEIHNDFSYDIFFGRA